MGNDIGKHAIPPPFTFTDFFVNGTLNASRHVHYRRCVNGMEDDTEEDDRHMSRKRKSRTNDSRSNCAKERHRSVKRHEVLVREDDASLREIRPAGTLWHLLHVAHPPSSKRVLNMFRLRFRLPHESFIQSCEDVEAHPIF